MFAREMTLSVISQTKTTRLTMSHEKTQNTAVEYEDKPDIVAQDDVAGLPNTSEAEPKLGTQQAVSRYADLTVLQTLKTFKLAALFGILAAFNAANDGYCYSIPGTL